MVIDILKLLREETGVLEGSADFDLREENFDGFSIPGPAQLNYKAVYEHGEVGFYFEISCVLNAECSRCLKHFKKPVKFEGQYSITQDDMKDEFPEIPVSANGELDLREFTYQEIVLEIFPILLCTEECPGLCSVCGKEKKECSCPKEEQGDPRLQILKQLLTEDDE